jgi:uncharacterized repeat protein (TIGR03803 family)
MAASVAVGFVIAMLSVQLAQAVTYKVLFSFNVADGAEPYSGVILDSEGNLYGAAQAGGAYGGGVVFKLSKAGQETVLYNFCPQSGCPDGQSPFGGLIRDAEGNLYGTTLYGGAGTGCYQYYAQPGCGTVFKLSKTGKETVLHSFKGGTDGELPWAGVIQDNEGNLYGTTWLGGGKGCYEGYGCGTVFRLSKTGKETVLHSFSQTDGDGPLAGVILANGNLYGTTSYGGANNGLGTVFMLTKTGKFFSELYAFSGQGDGAVPYAGLIRDANGTLYGTTAARGAYNYGTVFKLSTTGQETTLHSFTGGSDGESPRAPVIRDAKGNLYGTTLAQANGGSGTVFKLSKTGKETTLHTFTGGADGGTPYAGLIQDAKGNLYGTTYNGGTGFGVVFKLTP